MQRVEDRELVEVDATLRAHWYTPARMPPGSPIPLPLYRGPMCFALAADLGAEIRARVEDARVAGEADPATNMALYDATIQFDRQCPAFAPWRQGYSPKEHRDVQLADEVRQRQEQAIREQKEADRRFQLEQKEADRRWQEEQNRRNQRRSLVNIAAGAILTALIGLVVKLLF